MHRYLRSCQLLCVPHTPYLADHHWLPSTHTVCPHTEYPNLLAVGCYDGSVLVYDVHAKSPAPIYQATVRTGKHNDPVWSIFWQVRGQVACTDAEYATAWGYDRQAAVQCLASEPDYSPPALLGALQ
jgi:hypothetical protein